MAAGIDIAGIDENASRYGFAEEQFHGKSAAEGKPNIETALRHLPVCHVRKDFGQGLTGCLAAPLQFTAQSIQILFITATGQEPGQYLLRQGAGAIVDLHLDVAQALYDRFRRNHPADAQPWRQRFGNTSQIEDPATRVQAFQRWRRRSVKGQFFIRPIFNDGQIIAVA